MEDTGRMPKCVVIMRVVSVSFALLVPSFVAPAAATELAVSDVRVAREGASARVHFAIGWRNSWRTARNYDAAWVFVKLRPGGGTWRHAQVAAAPVTGAASTTGVPVPRISVPGDRAGVFVFSASPHRGAVQWRMQVPHEYPWGSGTKDRLRRVMQPDDDLATTGEADEARLTDETREALGASFYWVMDLAGSVWERAVTIGHPIGRAFRGTHGDGRLSGYGSATNDDWPRGDEAPGGYGYRGGGYYEQGMREGDFNPYSPIAYRRFGSWGQAPRSLAYGFRAVRTAPEIDREPPTPRVHGLNAIETRMPTARGDTAGAT